MAYTNSQPIASDTNDSTILLAYVQRRRLGHNRSMAPRRAFVQAIATVAAAILPCAALAACGGSTGPAHISPTVRVQPHRTAPAHRAPGATTVAGQTALAAVQGSAGCGLPENTGESVGSVESGGITRTYVIHIPVGYVPTEPTPLVLNFHGSSRTGPEQEAYSGLAQVADDNTFILVSPDGLNEEWTIADAGDPGAAETPDVVFTADLLAQLRAEYCIDDLRVFATGMSNGAQMASQVGCLLPDDFAAIAPVSGVEYDACSGGPMPVVAFHGTDDENVPFDTAEPAMADWAAHNGCTGGPATIPITEHVSMVSYNGCAGADVVLYVVDGGGHTWPGAAEDVPYGGAGPTTHEIDASALIWAFFAAHPKDG